jgi:hypothetical protein
MDPTGTTSSVNQLRPLFLNCVGSITFTNFATPTCFLDIYDIHPKMNVITYPEQDWSRGDTLEENDVVTNVAAESFQLSSTPYESLRFKAAWKIDKVTRIELTGGQTHVHRINYGRNKAIPNQTVQQQSAGSGATLLHGLGRCCMITTYGQPVKDSGAGGTGQITTAATELGIVTEFQYRSSLMTFPSRVIINQTGLAPATGATAPTFINELIDAKQMADAV